MGPTQPDLKLIAIDIDGTLLNSQHALQPSTIEALTTARERGLIIIPATGRARTTVAEGVIAQLGLDTPGVFLQGALVHGPDGAILHQQTLGAQITADLLAHVFAVGYSLVAYRGLDILTAARDEMTDNTLRYNEGEPQAVGRDGMHAAAGAFNKLVIWDVPTRIRELRGALAARFDHHLKLVEALPANLQDGETPTALEILPPRVSKATALGWILEDYGLAMRQVIALGDGENDIEMLAAAGVGVAMAEAHPGAKARADYVTGSNDADGVAEALRHYGLA